MTGVVSVKARAVDDWNRLRKALADQDFQVPCTGAADVWAGEHPDPQLIEFAENQCGRCPIIRECARYADTAGERGAVWGGRYRPTKQSIFRRELSA